MKRNKHVLINLTEDQYNQLLYIAAQQRRKTADMAYILLSDAINDLILKVVDINNSGFKPLQFKED